MKTSVKITNNAGQIVEVGQVVRITTNEFHAQPHVGRPWERFPSFDQALKYTRGE